MGGFEGIWVEDVSSLADAAVKGASGRRCPEDLAMVFWNRILPSDMYTGSVAYLLMNNRITISGFDDAPQAERYEYPY